jgi:glycerol uptake facilitator-like aquaporin
MPDMTAAIRPSLAVRAFAEALGTALLLATVVGSGIMGFKLSGGNVGIALLANSLATGAILTVLITILGPTSGAHFNPIVSLAELLRGQLGVGAFAVYVVAQIAAGIAGVLLAHAMFDLDILQTSATTRTGTGQWISEVVAAFGLVLAILLTVRHRPDFVAVVVGLYITSAYWFTASTSFANPAVTIARAFTGSFAGIAPADVAAFVGAQTVGALAALAAARALDR